MIKVNDFFCGAGGMGIGFKKAGYEIAGSWDFDKYAVLSYRHNVSNKVVLLDVREMRGHDVTDADVWTFGFPCQDLSLAGKRKGMIKNETRSGTFYEIMRLLREVNRQEGGKLPKVLLAENVKGVKKYLPEIEKEYDEAGYRMMYTVYNSKYWGVPQNRERYFIVGIRKDLTKAFVFPKENKSHVPNLTPFLDVSVDSKYYMKQEKANDMIQKMKERGFKTVDLFTSALIHSRGLEARKDFVSHCIKGAEGGSSKNFVIIDDTYGYDGIRIYPDYSPTLRSHRQGQKVVYQNPKAYIEGDSALIESNEPKYLLRRLTPREYARLQGFPENFEQIVSDTQFYRQMGNAVTVTVSYAIAKAIKEYLAAIE